MDLTCEPVDFTPPKASPPDETHVPGQFAFPTVHEEPDTPEPTYQVHSGILRMAKAMGDIGKPVQVAVQAALHMNPDYGPLISLLLDEHYAEIVQ